MANFHLYLLQLQHPDMALGDFNQLRQALRNKGQGNNSNNPNEIMHWRQKISPGESEVSFEALFDETQISDAWFITWLATDLAVPEIEIGVTEFFDIYGRTATFDHLGSQRFDILTYGQIDPTLPDYEDSRLANSQYIADNNLDWDLIGD